MRKGEIAVPVGNAKCGSPYFALAPNLSAKPPPSKQECIRSIPRWGRLKHGHMEQEPSRYLPAILFNDLSILSNKIRISIRFFEVPLRQKFAALPYRGNLLCERVCN